MNAMKIILVGVRDSRRVIHWPGACVAVLIIVALSALGYLAAQQIFGLLGGMPPLLPGIIITVFMALGCVLGVQMRRAWRMPLEQLPQLP